MKAKLIKTRAPEFQFRNMSAWQLPDGRKILLRSSGGFPPGAAVLEDGTWINLQTGEITAAPALGA
jgi:hypothetical protein